MWAVAATLWVNCLNFTLPENNRIITVQAHSGRTDGDGGHHDYKNKSGLGDYHYHCGGHPAHLHKNGICSYSSTSGEKKVVSTNSSVNDSVIKKVQKKLNKLGYNCGTADGVIGKKTKKAIIKYQKDKSLAVDGIIGKELKRSLGIK